MLNSESRHECEPSCARAIPGSWFEELQSKHFVNTVVAVRVLQTAFNVAFRERFTLGALVTFIVTVADVPIFNIGAPFWGLVIGYAVSRLLEHKDFGPARRD